VTDVLSILVLDDDSTFRRRLSGAFRARGHHVWEAEEDATPDSLPAFDSPLDLCVLDLRMPIPGLHWIPQVRQRLGTEGVLVVLTGYGSIATAVEAVRQGADDYLTKPADVDQLLAAYRRVTGRAPEREEEEYPVVSLDRLEWEHIQRILRDCDGNVTHAARRLGLHRQSLQRKLRNPPGGA